MTDQTALFETQWAIEADPGQRTASFPTHCSLADAQHAAEWLGALRGSQPPPRILTRTGTSEWTPVDE